jgi:putative ABC transport system permease protein
MPVKTIVNKKHSHGLFDSQLSTPIIIGLGFISGNIHRSLVSFLSIVFAVFIVEFSVNVTHSFSDLKNNRSAWGFDNGDVYVTLKHTLKYKRFIESLSEMDEIQEVTPFSYQTISVIKGGKAVQDIFGKSYSGDINKNGLLNIDGNHPLKDNEISLCSGTSTMYKKSIGDSITVRIEGEVKIMKITGIYQDVSNLGQGFRLNETAVKEVNPLYEPDNFIIKLKTGVNIESFKQQIATRYGSSINIELPIEEQQAFRSIMSNVKTSLFLVASFFIMVLITVIWSDLMINIRDYFKSFGVLKTLGFTPFQLRSTLIWRTLILVISGLISGIPLSILLSPFLMNNISAGIGLITFPFETSFGGTILIIPAILLVALTSSWLISAKATNINSRVLIAE